MPQGNQPPKIAELKFPTGGLVRRMGYEESSQTTTPDCNNVRPYDDIDVRQRGGSRPGTVKAFSQQMGNGANVQCLTPVTYVSTDGNSHTSLAVICNGTLYTGATGNLAAVTGNSINGSYPNIQATGQDGQLFIADRRSVNIQGTGYVSSSVLTTNASLSTMGIDATNDVVCLISITDPLTGNVAAGSITDDQSDIFPITSVSGSNLYLAATSLYGNAADALTGNCTYIIDRLPKVYDPQAGAITNLAPTFGLTPMGCPLVVSYRDRLVLAGPADIWYMSRSGDASDFDYGAQPDDALRAVAGTATAAGGSGAPIRAIIPHSDDYLIFACENSMWILRGDPALGGQLYALSRTIGVSGPNAWCHIPDGSVLFLSRDGIYQIPAAAQGYPQSVSRNVLPRELIDVDETANLISMAYDTRYRGVHIYITPTAGTAGNHWWFDMVTTSFWPMSMPDSQQPTAAVRFTPDPGMVTYVYLGCLDGYVRRYDDAAKTDDGTTINSYVIFDPMRIGGPGMYGILSDIEADLDQESDPVTWSVAVADTPEMAIRSVTPPINGMWLGGRNYRANPRVRGGAVAVKLQSTGRWALESLRLTGRAAGRMR